MGNLEKWIHIEAIQVITHHASAALVAVLVFGVMGRLITRMMPEGHARKVVKVIDDVVLILVLLIFGWELLVYLWGRHLSFLKRPPLLNRLFGSSIIWPGPARLWLGARCFGATPSATRLRSDRRTAPRREASLQVR